MAADEYALWLLLSTEDEQPIRSTIEQLAIEWGTSPLPPHVTLTSGLRQDPMVLADYVRQLAQSVRAMRVTLGSVGNSPRFFRCVYVHVPATEEFVQARAVARSQLQQLPQKRYLPHVSLVYGTLAASARRRIVSGLHFGGMEVVLDRIALARGSATTSPVTWSLVSAFPLVPFDRHASTGTDLPTPGPGARQCSGRLDATVE
jgi:2'-5' RNA ligase